MSVLQKLFSHPPPQVPTTPAMPLDGETNPAADTTAEASDELLDFVDDGDPLLHDPGEPPHWTPECGTPAYSTRHHTGA